MLIICFFFYFYLDFFSFLISEELYNSRLSFINSNFFLIICDIINAVVFDFLCFGFQYSIL